MRVASGVSNPPAWLGRPDEANRRSNRGPIADHGPRLPLGGKGRPSPSRAGSHLFGRAGVEPIMGADGFGLRCETSQRFPGRHSGTAVCRAHFWLLLWLAASPGRPGPAGPVPRAGSTGWFHELVPRAGPSGWSHGLVPRAGPSGWSHGLVPRAGPTGWSHGPIPRADPTARRAIRVPLKRWPSDRVALRLRGGGELSQGALSSCLTRNGLSLIPLAATVHASFACPHTG